VAPTLLHLLDVPLPTHMDGRVLVEALAAGGVVRMGLPAAEDGPSPSPYRAGQAAAVDKRLRGLGYLP
jgi:hypothetical protein